VTTKIETLTLQCKDLVDPAFVCRSSQNIVSIDETGNIDRAVQQLDEQQREGIHVRQLIPKLFHASEVQQEAEQIDQHRCAVEICGETRSDAKLRCW
jgi:hypothetical protein